MDYDHATDTRPLSDRRSYYGARQEDRSVFGCRAYKVHIPRQYELRHMPTREKKTCPPWAA